MSNLSKNTVKVKEIFTSIQGEGPLIGYKQLFIRFCGCNLNCNYCDTNFDIENSKDYTLNELLEIEAKNLDCHSISLTGGEPLLHINFLKNFVKKTQLPVYLETNATLPNNLMQIIDDIDYISADIKLPSCTGLDDKFNLHDIFFNVASQKCLYAKVVFDTNITDDEIFKCLSLCKKYNIELVLQPKMVNNNPAVTSDFMILTLNKFLNKYNKVRLIPQVHKFINVV